jgi:hypothetical protein
MRSEERMVYRTEKRTRNTTMCHNNMRGCGPGRRGGSGEEFVVDADDLSGIVGM